MKRLTAIAEHLPKIQKFRLEAVRKRLLGNERITQLIQSSQSPRQIPADVSRKTGKQAR
jgi:hypothetical protein